MESGKIEGGMVPKVTAGLESLAAGVNKVHLVGGNTPHSLLIEIFTDRGVGTQMVH
jgi:acetylglutamate kinase